MASNYEQLVNALRCCGNVNTDCTVCPWDKYNFGLCAEKLYTDAAAAIESLQAEVNRLKATNDELREKQTYIDHYGDKWMTSAKDVPTAAYKHGYADGRDEAMAKMEVRE